MPTTETPGIEHLRAVAKWAELQLETWWDVGPDRVVSVADIFLVHSFCVSWDVITIDALLTHEDKRARRALVSWCERVGQLEAVYAPTIPSQ